jgi:hypothetical protein
LGVFRACTPHNYVGVGIGSLTFSNLKRGPSCEAVGDPIFLGDWEF